jgi:hypothetical protein
MCHVGAHQHIDLGGDCHCDHSSHRNGYSDLDHFGRF